MGWAVSFPRPIWIECIPAGPRFDPYLPGALLKRLTGPEFSGRELQREPAKE
jgi:hypothetical protein